MTRVLLLFLLAAGCERPLRKDQTVCPEHRDLRCMTAPECSMDERRGCRVCSCKQPEDDISRQPDDDVPHPISE